MPEMTATCRHVFVRGTTMVDEKCLDDTMINIGQHTSAKCCFAHLKWEESGHELLLQVFHVRFHLWPAYLSSNKSISQTLLTPGKHNRRCR